MSSLLISSKLERAALALYIKQSGMMDKLKNGVSKKINGKDMVT